MASKFNLELKVGIFAFMGLVILTLAVFSISELYILSPGYMIKTTFSFASGISVGAPVRVAGISAGEVKEIKMVYDDGAKQTKVVLSVRIREGIRIPRDSIAFVSVEGLIGETYLEIIPQGDYAHILASGDTLEGRDPISTETVMEIARNVAENFNKVLDSINDLLDENMRRDVKQTASNFRTFSDGLNAQMKEDLQETVANFHDLSSNVKTITGRLERGEGKLGAWLKPRASDIRKREEEAKKLEEEQKKLEEEIETQSFN